jgi:hypothetical protein
MTRTVPGFTPKEAGLHFPNDFPEGTRAVSWIPAAISLPGGRSITVNDASAGLCGGMALTAIDYFEAGRRRPPEMTTPPGRDDPLFRHLVKRLVDSWDIPAGVARYLELMNPSVSDGEVWWKVWDHGRAHVMIRKEWPGIQRDIDSGHPSPLGLIRIKSWNPMDLKHNHQVVAWGYDLVGTQLTLFLYDPNLPDDDEVRMTLSVADPRRATPVTYSPQADLPTWCFFRVTSSPVAPPGGLA